MEVSTCNRFAPAHSILVKEANMHKGFDSRLDQAWWALRIGLGVGPFLAGLAVQRTNLHAHRRRH